MRVHLFGLPLSTHNRLKEESRNWQDAVPAPHNFRSTPIMSNELGKISQSEIEELAKGVGEGFNHLVLAGMRDWPKVRSSLRFDCRIHIARLREPIRDLTWPLLQEHLRSVVSMDQVWLSKLAPKDLRHPLLLPPPVFATNRDTAEYWQRCDVYSEERFTSAEMLLAVVEKHHRRRDRQERWYWLDDRNRRYQIDLARHGLSQADRAGVKSYRFCFEIPPGFHYDVTHDYDGEFTIEIDGRFQRVSHCNVTPWGNVRRG
ncbi:MAG: hypothetical protein ABSF71_38440 [Terriglobia bacterium]